MNWIESSFRGFRVWEIDTCTSEKQADKYPEEVYARFFVTISCLQTLRTITISTEMKIDSKRRRIYNVDRRTAKSYPIRFKGTLLKKRSELWGIKAPLFYGEKNNNETNRNQRQEIRLPTLWHRLHSWNGQKTLNQREWCQLWYGINQPLSIWTLIHWYRRHYQAATRQSDLCLKLRHWSVDWSARRQSRESVWWFLASLKKSPVTKLKVNKSWKKWTRKNCHIDI